MYFHKLFYGRQDEVIEELKQRPDGGSLPKYTRIISSISVPMNSKKICLTDFVPPEHLTKCGIANIEINGHCESIELEIGRQRMDKIYPIVGQHQFTMIPTGHAIPCTTKHEIEISAVGANVVVNFDIVELHERDYLTDKIKDYVVSLTQFTGSELTTKKHKLYFNHPLTKIYVYCGESHPTRISLYCNVGAGPFLIGELTKEEKYWVIRFEHSINTSRIDQLWLEIDGLETETHVFAFAESLNVFSSNNEFSGLKFSK